MPIIYLYLQVEYFCMACSILQRNVRICGLFSVNLGSLFTLFSEITTFAIILIQTDYMKLMKNM